MIDTLNSGKQGTRRTVIPSGKKDGPAERKKLNTLSEAQRLSRLQNASFVLARRQLSVRLGEFDDLGMDIPMY
jgi:hypothetical protein